MMSKELYDHLVEMTEHVIRDIDSKDMAEYILLVCLNAQQSSSSEYPSKIMFVAKEELRNKK